MAPMLLDWPPAPQVVPTHPAQQNLHAFSLHYTVGNSKTGRPLSSRGIQKQRHSGRHGSHPAHRPWPRPPRYRGSELLSERADSCSAFEPALLTGNFDLHDQISRHLFLVLLQRRLPAWKPTKSQIPPHDEASIDAWHSPATPEPSGVISHEPTRNAVTASAIPGNHDTAESPKHSGNSRLSAVC